MKGLVVSAYRRAGFLVLFHQDKHDPGARHRFADSIFKHNQSFGGYAQNESFAASSIGWNRSMSSTMKNEVKPKGSPALLVLLIVVLAPALLIGQVFGAGGASIVGGFVAMFTLIATMSGPLRADLRRFAVIGPLIAVSSVAPRMLAEVSVPGAIALTTLVVFVGGLLPLRGKRYESVALGLGMGTLFGYAMPIVGGADAGQLVAAALTGLVVALILRVVMGVKDPTGPTRDAVASFLNGDSDDFTSAFDTWSSDRPTRWLGAVLVSAVQYRLARRTLSWQSATKWDGASSVALDDANARADAIAETIKAKSGEASSATVVEDVSDVALDAPLTPVEAMFAALDAVETAVRVRDSRLVSVSPGVGTRLNIAAVRAGLWHGSVQIRHAVRTAVAVLLALLVSTRLDLGDPFVPTLLMTTFAIVQLSWKATLSKMRDRLAGVLIGGLLVVFVVLVLPAALLLPISLVGLAVGLWFITAKPAIGAAGILLMSVGINTELRHLDPTSAIVEYVVLTLVAIGIGGVVGFVAVPAWRPPPLAERVEAAMTKTSVTLSDLGADLAAVHPESTRQRLGGALAAVQQLVPDRERLTDDQTGELDCLRENLRDVLSTALFMVSSKRDAGDAAVFEDAARILAGEEDSMWTIATSGMIDDALLEVAREAARQRLRVRTGLG